MKLLISGASGLLGMSLNRVATRLGHHCIGLNRGLVSLDGGELSAKGLDALFGGVDHFIHAAANTDVERCELEPNNCYRDNVRLTALLTNTAARLGVPMTYVSSTGVYGSLKETPWIESDQPEPTTHYHRSKLLGEHKVLDASNSNLIIRTGWLFGTRQGARKCFVIKRLEEARKQSGGVIYSNPRQFGSPTNVDDLSVRMLALIEKRASGIFNVVNTGTASRLDYVLEAISAAAINVKVLPVEPEYFNRLANVSNNEMALNHRSESIGLPPMPPWREALARFIKQLTIEGKCC